MYHSRYPKISQLANLAGKRDFKFPLSEARNKELLKNFSDPEIPLHGGVSRVLGGSLAVKTFINGRYLMLGYFPGPFVVNALRYADMATIYFAKYKTRRGVSKSYLETNRGQLKHVFN